MSGNPYSHMLSEVVKFVDQEMSKKNLIGHAEGFRGSKGYSIDPSELIGDEAFEIGELNDMIHVLSDLKKRMLALKKPMDRSQYSVGDRLYLSPGWTEAFPVEIVGFRWDERRHELMVKIKSPFEGHPSEYPFTEHYFAPLR